MSSIDNWTKFYWSDTEGSVNQYADLSMNGESLQKLKCE